MLATSTDLLLIVIAFCILWITAFVSWGMYYMIQMMKDAHGLVRDVKRRVEAVDAFLSNVSEKVENSSAALKAIMETVGMVGGYVAAKKKVRRRTER